MRIEPVGGGDGGEGHAEAEGDPEAGIALLHHVALLARDRELLPDLHPIRRLDPVGLGNRRERHAGALGDPAQRLAFRDDMLGFGLGIACRDQQQGREGQRRQPLHPKRSASSPIEAWWVRSSWSGVTET